MCVEHGLKPPPKSRAGRHYLKLHQSWVDEVGGENYLVRVGFPPLSLFLRGQEKTKTTKKKEREKEETHRGGERGCVVLFRLYYSFELCGCRSLVGDKDISLRAKFRRPPSASSPFLFRSPAPLSRENFYGYYYYWFLLYNNKFFFFF